MTSRAHLAVTVLVSAATAAAMLGATYLRDATLASPPPRLEQPGGVELSAVGPATAGPVPRAVPVVPVARDPVPAVPADTAVLADSSVAALEREVAALRAEVARQAEALRWLQLGAEPVEPDEHDHAALVIEDEVNRRTSALHLRERGDELAFAFDNDVYDAQWTDAVLGGLEKIATDGVYLAYGECRTTLCRIELEFEDAAARAHFEIDFPTVVHDVIGGMAAAAADGPGASVLYLSRPGARLP